MGLYVAFLLRNCTLDQLAGSTIDEGEADLGRALTQAANDALAVLRVVRGGSQIAVDQTILEHAIDEDGELAGRRGDRFGLAHPVGQAFAPGSDPRLAFGGSGFAIERETVAAVLRALPPRPEGPPAVFAVEPMPFALRARAREAGGSLFPDGFAVVTAGAVVTGPRPVAWSREAGGFKRV